MKYPTLAIRDRHKRGLMPFRTAFSKYSCRDGYFKPVHEGDHKAPHLPSKLRRQSAGNWVLENGFEVRRLNLTGL